MDHWIADSPLQEAFPELFMLTLQPEISVAKFLNHCDKRTLFRETLNRFTEAKIDQLANILLEANLTTTSDKIIWKWDVKGKFSTRNCYNHLLHGGTTSYLAPLLWKTPLPSKLKIFNWLLFQNKILTAKNLEKRHMQIQFKCPLCAKDEESADHLFAECTFTRQIWNLIGQKLNINLNFNSIDDLWREQRLSLPNQIKPKAWDTLVGRNSVLDDLKGKKQEAFLF
ncbi:uncharacterized protein [Elaeis guineensis]|uniref:uncharacterized protein n=1 Tax=Elaeis guineensis var. tenera TaxID=51953 RepID=UPI003C6D16B2